MLKTITCTVDNPTKAEEVIDRLRAGGFSNGEISMLFAESVRDKFTIERHSKAPEGAATGAGAGGVIGGILGWLAGIGTFAVPGVGPFIAAGPILSALSGSAVGAAVGGLIGSLVGLGIPEMKAKKYESKLKDGHVLVFVRSEDPDRIHVAREIFQSCEAEDISESKELAA